MNWRSCVAAVALCMGVMSVATIAPASAQELPKKPLTVVVGFAAGGAADSAARIIAKN